MKTVLVICASQRDRLNLADERILARFDLRFLGGPVTPALDPRVFVEQVAALHPAVDGVLGANDATAHLARAVSERLGLPGPSLDAFRACHDKLASRRIQARAVPEVTPPFAELAIDGDGGLGQPPLPYPFFVKPIVGHLSQLAFPVGDAGSLRRVLARARREIDAVTAFDRALAGRPLRSMIAERLLEGRLVTFEGFMHEGRMTPIGVTDSVMHANGISFVRFEYPSTLAAGIQEAMAEVAARLMPALGFDGSLFNLEFFVGPAGELSLVEVNGRMASQFSPLVAAVHGVSSYELQLDLVTGGTPKLPPGRPDMVAGSFVLRCFRRDGMVRSVPDPEQVARRFGHAHVELYVAPGQRLSESGDNDPASHRLAVVALAARDRAALARRWREARRLLRFEIDPLPERVSALGPGPNADT